MKRKREENPFLEWDHCYCLLDLNYSSHLLSTKIADIPHEFKYETILAPIFDYCFGTSNQDLVWEHLTTKEQTHCFENDDESNNNSSSSIINLKIDWIRDETFITSQIFNLVPQKVVILARKFKLWNNRQFILNCCSIMNMDLPRHVKNLDFYIANNEDFNNDRELIMAIVKQNGSYLEFASDELKNDREIVKQAVKSFGLAFEFASEKLKDDKEIVLIALESIASVYTYASDRLKNDRDVVFKAVSQGITMSQVSEEFRTDGELLIIYAKKHGFFDLAHSESRNDKEFVKQSIQEYPFVFKSVPDELKNDREFVKEIVMINGKCLIYGSKEFQNDREIVELALKSSPDVIHYISDGLRNDIEFILNAIGKRGFESLPSEFSNERQVVLESIRQCEANFELASMELQNDREFVLQAVKNNGMALEYVHEDFKSDREIVMEAVTQYGNALEFVPDQFLDDLEIISKATQTTTSYFLSKFIE